MVDDTVIPVERASFATMLLMFVFGGGCALVLGVLWEGQRVFQLEDAAAVFLFHGVGCSLVFAFHQWRGLMLSLLAAVLIAGIYGLLAGRFFVSVFISSGLALFACIFTGVFMWGKTFSRVLFGRFLYVGLVLAVAAMLSTIVLALAYGTNIFSELLLNNIVRGGLIGLGAGFGFELAELVTGHSKRRIERLSHPVDVP